MCSLDGKSDKWYDDDKHKRHEDKEDKKDNNNSNVELDCEDQITATNKQLSGVLMYHLHTNICLNRHCVCDTIARGCLTTDTHPQQVHLEWQKKLDSENVAGIVGNNSWDTGCSECSMFFQG